MPASKHKNLQLERLIFFTDAVLAIAITLLIIDIKAPEIEKLHIELGRAPNMNQKIDQLVLLIPKFLGFFVSFFIVGFYWVSHHKVFGYLKNFDYQLVWLNLLFLFTIALMPFSTSYFNENFGEKIPFAFYCFNVMASGLSVFLLANRLITHQHLSEGLSEKHTQQLVKARLLMVPAGFFISFLLSFFLPVFIASYGPTSIFLGMYIIGRVYGEKKVRKEKG